MMSHARELKIIEMLGQFLEISYSRNLSYFSLKIFIFVLSNVEVLFRVEDYCASNGSPSRLNM
jgi:hypothetical protein